MKQDKRVRRLLSKPADYTFTEAKALLAGYGYKLYNKGSTSGSKVMFYREADGKKILLHKPHPEDIMPKYAVNDLIDALIEGGDIDDR